MPPGPKASERARTHTLIVAVRRNLAPAAEKKLAILVLVRQDGGALAGAVVTPRKPLTVLLDRSRLYRVTAEIDSCKGRCVASSRISGSANHTLEIVPSCRLEASGFACRNVTIVTVR